MKASIFLICLLFLFSCSDNKKAEDTLTLKPEFGKKYFYTADDQFGMRITLPEGEREVYAKHIYDYSVKYERKDSSLNATITFQNFRIEFEDGDGLQVFDTKFDKAAWENIELWFYYSMLKQSIAFRFGTDSRVKEVKGVEQLKQKMVKLYESNGVSTKTFTSILHQFVDNFAVNRMTYENYAFYTGRPLSKDSSYSLYFTLATPVNHTLRYQYSRRSETDTSLTLAGKGTVTLNDSLKQQYPFSLLQTKNLRSEGFDEVVLHKQTKLLHYRKSYFNLADSIRLNDKNYPTRIIVEKEVRLKNRE
jgi:Family of unknown function (DUF6263)